MQPINIYNSQDVNVTIDDNGTPVDVYINSTPVDVYVSGGFATALEFYPTFGDFPAQGQGGILYIAEDTNYIYRWDGAYVQVGGGSLVWGQITGTLSNQTDLQTALDDKVPYTGATQNINIGNNQLIADDGTNDSAFAPSFIGVEDSSGYSFLDPNGVYVVDLSGQMEVNASGLVFPDSSIQTTAGISGVDWGDIQGTLSNQTDLQTALDGKVDENTAITADTKTKITYDSKGLVTSGADAEISDITGLQTALDNAANKSLQDITDIGNTTTNDIQLINDADVILGAGGKVIMDNGAKLQEGTTDAGNGGSKGIALKCSADYELKWEAGRLYTMEQNGFTIREVSHNFTFPPTVNDDDAKGFVIDSRWILDNGDIYICSDATTGSAVWSLQASPSGTVTSVDTEGLISGGPITTSGTITTSMANNKLVGRYSSGTGIMEEIIVGDGLTLTGAGRLNNTATPTELGYYGAWQDNVTQTAAVSNIGYPMIFRTVDLENQVRVVTNGTNLTRITFDNTGIYNLQFSSQFQNTSNQLADVTIWLRLNGTDVAGSSGFISIPNSHGGTPGHSIASWNYLLSVIAGQYYELVWSTTNHTNVTMEFYSAGSPPPSTASVILTVTQQSGIMAGTGITALNSLTGSVQTLVSGTSGSDFGISSSGTIHTFNLPTASATNRGALSSTDWSTFNSKESALTFSSPLSRSVNTISIPVASSSANGYLSSTDWNTFNGKQNALTNPVTGTGTSNELAYFSGTSAISSLSTTTYPSLTELSYVKGVTSSIQTQLNGKQATLTNPVTGTGTSGQIAYWNGTSSQTGSATLTYTPTTSLLVNNSVTASGAIARGTNLTPTLIAAANNDVLVGLDINPTFTNGAFTGVKNIAIRVGATNPTNLGNINIVQSNNGIVGFSVKNTNASTSAQSGFYVENDGASVGQLYKMGTGATAYKTIVANDLGFYNGTTAGDISILNDYTSGKIKLAAGGSSTVQATLFSTGNLAIGTTTDSLAKLTVSGSITASSAIARGVYFNNTLVAAANNDVLVGLDIATTFTNGAFTGVTNYAIRTSSSTCQFGTVGGATGNFRIDGVNGASYAFAVYSSNTLRFGVTGFGGLTSNNTSLDLGTSYLSVNQIRLGENVSTNTLSIKNASVTNNAISIKNNAGVSLFTIPDSGNVLIGTTTDSGYKLDVNGTARVQNSLTISAGGLTVTGASTFNNAITASITGNRLGNFQFISSGNASTTGLGFSYEGTTIMFQGYTHGAGTLTNQAYFGFRHWNNSVTTLTGPNSSGILRIYNIGWNDGNTNSISGNSLWLQPIYNFTGSRTGITVRGFYYDPVLTSITNTTHYSIETVSGDALFGTTSGSVGIGANTSINASAILHITSTSKGFLPPKMTGAQGEAISSPAEGLMIYTTSAGSGAITSSGWWGYNGTTWVKLN